MCTKAIWRKIIIHLEISEILANCYRHPYFKGSNNRIPIFPVQQHVDAMALLIIKQLGLIRQQDANAPTKYRHYYIPNMFLNYSSLLSH